MVGPHRLTALFTLAIMLLWGSLFGWTVQRAALPPEASGRVIALYPFGWDGPAVIAAAMRTEALLVRETWLPNALELASDEAGFANRLRGNGAIGVYRALPFSLFTMAGCTGLPPLLPSRGRFG